MKNKKTYYPFGIGIAVFLIFAAVAIGVLIFILIKYHNLARELILSVLIALTLYSFFKPFFVYRIIFNEKTIFINKDFGIFKEDRIQSKVEVNLEEVSEFKVVLTETNSDGEKIKGLTKKNKFLELIMNDGSKKRLSVSNMNKKQLLSIVKRIEESTNKELTIK